MQIFPSILMFNQFSTIQFILIKINIFHEYFKKIWSILVDKFIEGGRKNETY